MYSLDLIAESRILQAIEAGVLDDLPGTGRPLCLVDDANVPVELRVAFRVLKNAGCIPLEIDMRREITNLHQLLRVVEDPTERVRVHKKLDLLTTRLSLYRGSESDLRLEPRYYDKLQQKLA